MDTKTFTPDTQDAPATPSDPTVMIETVLDKMRPFVSLYMYKRIKLQSRSNSTDIIGTFK